jgi:hypothetical protein
VYEREKNQSQQQSHLHLQPAPCWPEQEQGRGRQRQGRQRHSQQQPAGSAMEQPRLPSVFSPQQTPLPKPLAMLQIPQAMSLSPLSQQGRQHSR